MVFGNAVQDAVGADHGGVDGAGKNQNTHHHDKDVKRQPQQLRSCEVHGEAAEEVIGIGLALGIRNDHACQQA